MAYIERRHIGDSFSLNRKVFSRNDIIQFGARLDITVNAMDRILDVKTYYNSARLLPYAKDFFCMLTALGICELDMADIADDLKKRG